MGMFRNSDKIKAIFKKLDIDTKNVFVFGRTVGNQTMGLYSLNLLIADKKLNSCKIFGDLLRTDSTLKAIEKALMEIFVNQKVKVYNKETFQTTARDPVQYTPKIKASRFEALKNNMETLADLLDPQISLSKQDLLIL